MPSAVMYFIAAMLFVGILPLPYGYYMLLRLVACGAFGFAAYEAYKRKHNLLLWLFGLMALLFNPILTIHFTKEVWMGIDFFAAILLIVTNKISAKACRARKTEKEAPTQTDQKNEDITKDDSTSASQTYTDPKTGLMWARNCNIAGKQMNWNEAKNWVKRLDYGGYCDWRLPTLDELWSFPCIGGHKRSWLKTNGFYNIGENYYWTSSTDMFLFASVYDLEYGHTDSFLKNDNCYYVWPVRSK